MLLTEIIYQFGFGDVSKDSKKHHSLTFPRTMHAIVTSLRHPRAEVRGHACELAVAVHHVVGSSKFEPKLTKLRLSTINALGAALLEAYNQRAEREKLPPLEVWKWQDARLLTHIEMKTLHQKNPNRDRKNPVNKSPFLARGGGTHAAAAAAQAHHDNLRRLKPKELPPRTKKYASIKKKTVTKIPKKQPPLQQAPLSGVKNYSPKPGASPVAPEKPKPARRGGRATKPNKVSKVNVVFNEGKLGVNVKPDDANEYKAVVSLVTPGQSAAVGGLRVGDRILSVGSKSVKGIGFKEVQSLLLEAKKKRPFKIQVLRAVDSAKKLS